MNADEVINSRYEVLTPNGFQHFDKIVESRHDSYIKISTIDDSLICSHDHVLYMQGEPIMAKHVVCGMELDGSGFVWDVEEREDQIVLYDLFDVKGGHKYFTNKFISSNCDCDFSTSGDSVIAITKLNELKERNVIPPIEKQGQKGELWIWKEPEEESVYMCVADVARGDGEDFSGCIVFDIDTLEQVAEYKGFVGAKEYGNLLLNLATRYNDAVLVIENTGVGWATIQAVIDREYKNLFYSYRGSEDAYVDINVQRAKQNYSNIDKKNMVPGFSMTAKVRPHIIEKMEQFIRDDEVIIRSERLINELKTFVWMNGKAQAMRGYHDDLVMPLCTAIWIRETALRMKNVGRKYSKKMLEAINTNVPQDNTNRINNPYYMEVNSVDKQDNDVRWLFSEKDKQADNIHKQHRPPPNNLSNKPPGIYLGSG